MAVGYACLTMGVSGTGIRTCTKKNANEERLTALIAHNLESLETIFDYNAANRIRLYRISSDIIPFASSPVNSLPWQTMFRQRFQQLALKISDAGLRVSMHPGQYTVLNSPNDDIVRNAQADLMYHAEFLDCLNVPKSSKIILHIGGAYADKRVAAKRFIENFRSLPDNVRARLVLENDDKLFNIGDVLDVANAIGVPVVFDEFHNKVNPSCIRKNTPELIDLCAATWKNEDGNQKIHYSQQAEGRKSGSHSDTISSEKFLIFYEQLPNKNIDIMLEVKDKNISAVKCINLIDENPSVVWLEKEWSRYKYLVLEKSPQIYSRIRELLKDKNNCPINEFYVLVEKAASLPENRGCAVNAAQHIAGYFKTMASESEKQKIARTLNAYVHETIPAVRMKKMLFRLAEKYEVEYLLRSYYFLT